MRHITVFRIIWITIVPNLLVLLSLLYLWVDGSLIVADLWRPLTSYKLLYGLVILVLYLGVASWISLMIHLFMTKFPTFANAVRWNRDSVPLIVIIPYTVSLLAMVTFLVPYVMARSHLTVSLIREMGFYGDTVTVIFTALSSYGFLWNLTDKLKGETAQAKTN